MPLHAQIVNTSSGDGSIKILSDMGLHDKKQRKEDPHGRSLLPYKMSKVSNFARSSVILVMFDPSGG